MNGYGLLPVAPGREGYVMACLPPEHTVVAQHSGAGMIIRGPLLHGTADAPASLLLDIWPADVDRSEKIRLFGQLYDHGGSRLIGQWLIRDFADVAAYRAWRASVRSA